MTRAAWTQWAKDRKDTQLELVAPPTPVELPRPITEGSRRVLLAGVAFPLSPSVNSYWGTKVVFSKQQRRPMSLTYVTHAGRAYQKHIRELLLERKAWYRSENPLLVRLLVCFDSERRSDVDNRAKAALDALMNGGLFVDDSQIEQLEMRRGPTTKPAVMFVWVEEILPDRNANLAWIREPL